MSEVTGGFAFGRVRLTVIGLTLGAAASLLVGGWFGTSTANAKFAGLDMGFGSTAGTSADYLQLGTPSHFDRNTTPAMDSVTEYLDYDRADWVHVHKKWCSLAGNPSQNQNVKNWVDRAAGGPYDNDKSTLITIGYAAPSGLQKAQSQVACAETGDQQLPAHTNAAQASMKNTMKALYDCLRGNALVPTPTCTGPNRLADVKIEIGAEMNFAGKSAEPIARKDARFFWDLVNYTARSSDNNNWAFPGGIGYGGLFFRKAAPGGWDSTSVNARDYLEESITGSRAGDPWTHYGTRWFDAYAMHTGHCVDPDGRTRWSGCDGSVSNGVSDFRNELWQDNQNTPLWYTGLIPTETGGPDAHSQAVQSADSQDIWMHLRTDYCASGPRAFDLIIWSNLVDRAVDASAFGYIGFWKDAKPQVSGVDWPFEAKQVADDASTWSHTTC